MPFFLLQTIVKIRYWSTLDIMASVQCGYNSLVDIMTFVSLCSAQLNYCTLIHMVAKCHFLVKPVSSMQYDHYHLVHTDSVLVQMHHTAHR